MKISRNVLVGLTVVLLLVLVGCAREETAPAEEAAPTAEVATPVDPATAASVTGKVVFQGTAPRRNRLRMDADAACAKLHAGPVLSQEVVVNDNGTLRSVFVYVKEGPGNRPFPTPSQPVVLDQQGCMYQPHVVGVMTNQEIHILNSDDTTHNIHPVPNNNREWNRSMAPGTDKLVESFPREELLIPVKCNIHPWMRSYVGVLKHPFFAVTGEDGSFSISGLPPGDYTLAAWHEKYATVEQQVTLGPQESKEVEFAFSAGGGD
jgi:hypothetical protein